MRRRGLIWSCALTALFLFGCGGGGGGSGAADTPSAKPPPAKPPAIPRIEIFGVYPDVGPADGGTLVSVTGAGFEDPMAVTFGDYEATDVVVEDAYTLQCRVPPSRVATAGLCVDVTVQKRTGRDTFRDGFCYYCEVIEGLQWRNEGRTIRFSWHLSARGREINVFRGRVPIATLAGDATSFTTQETDMGLFRYTFILAPCGNRVSAVVDLGRLVWDPPAELVEGYFVYVATRTNGFPAKEEPSYVAGYRTEIRLREIYDNGVIKSAGVIYFALSSYYHPFISEMSEIVSCNYAVALDEAP